MRATRKDFDRVARIVKASLYLCAKGQDPQGVISLMGEDLADFLADGNATFSRERFLTACGIDLTPCRGKE